jgi:hypothetical protein
MKIGTRVALKGDDFQDPGVIVGIRRKSLRHRMEKR